MIAVIFEVEPAPGRQDTYLDIAAHLKPTLETIDGFISVEGDTDKSFTNRFVKFGSCFCISGGRSYCCVNNNFVDNVFYSRNTSIVLCFESIY